MKKLISALRRIVAFKSDSLSILKSMIDDHVGSYDYLMSSAGDDEWEYRQSEDGELNRHEWAKEEDEFNSQMGNPAHFFYNTKELKSSWLVHFTDASPLSILKEGFKGRDYFGIGLTTQFKQDANPGDLAFAYPINKIKEMFRYGNNAVVLKVPECLEAYHIGDEEDQIIFDVNKVTKMFGLVYKKGTDEYAVINKNGKEVKRFLATKANLKKLAVGSTKTVPDKEDLEFFFDVVNQYTSPLPTDSFSGLGYLITCIKELPQDILDKHNDYPFEVYRGTQISKKKYTEILKGGSLKIKPSSWSKDEDEAIKFARGWTDPKTHSILITKKISNSDILLDLEAMASDGFFETTAIDIDRIVDESEIILKGITVTKDNIQLVDRDEDAEYAQGSLQCILKSNPKTKSNNTFSSVKDTDFPYYRVSDSKRKPSATEDDSRHDPYGIYLFIKGEYVDVGGWSDMKYRWDAKLKSGTRLLDLGNIKLPLAIKLFKSAGLPTLRDVWNVGKQDGVGGSYDIPEEEVNNLFYPLTVGKDNPTDDDLRKNLMSKKHINAYRILRLQYPYFKTNKAFSQIFESAGYDGLKDDDGGGAIYPMEPQIIIFNPANIIWGNLEKNIVDDDVYCLQ